MIPVDVLDTTATSGATLEKAARLVEAVRATGLQRDTLEFLTHVRAVAREADEAMAEAIPALRDAGTLGNSVFARVYAAGVSHSAMMAFCESLAADPAEAVRLAGAAGAYVLGRIASSPEHVKVIMAMKERLEQAA